MTPLQTAIARAQAEQYPSKTQPSMTPYQKAEKQSEKDRWVSVLDQHLVAAGFTIAPAGAAVKTFGWNIVEREHRFHPERMWRFDRAIVYKKIGIEVDGGSFGRVVVCNHCNRAVQRVLKDGRRVPVREGGRHNTGAGMQADHEKMNAAVSLGWRVLRFTSAQIKDGYAQTLIASLAKNPTF